MRTDWQGKLIGRYQLERILGSGELSEVWLATDTQLRRQVAIKLLPPATNDQGYLRDFMYEARAAASLEHPHILVIHDFGQEKLGGEVVPYLVFPYVAGGTLATRMNESSGPLPIQESLRYLRQAALAIDYAHSRRILHRDIKPANMLLRDDWLLLTDFGLARVLGGSMARSQTSAGAGTPEYMAPEQIMGQALPASDRYSLAVVAYQLFTGRPPFQGATPVETISQQMRDPLPPPRSLNPHIPIMVENLLTVALSRNPELRPPSCLELVDALQRAWMTGKQTEPNPEATLLAPWSKRWQEQAGPEEQSSDSGSSPVPPAWSEVQGKPANKTSVLPAVDEAEPPPTHQTGTSRTLTDANRTSGPPTPDDPFATNTSASEARPSNTALTPPYQPGGLERKVGRRAILLGGIGAAAVAVAGGAVAVEVLRAHSSTPQSLQATPTPAGPLNLVPGEPVLQLTGHTGAVWTASWHPGGRYLMTAGADGYIMLWDINTALQQNIPGSLLATPAQKWSVAGLKFENVTDAICWSMDGKSLIVGNTFNDKTYVLDAFHLSGTPTIYKDQDLSIMGDGAINGCVTAGPTRDQFTVVNNNSSSGTQIQTWRFGQTDLPLLNYDVAEEVYLARWSPDGSTLAALTGVLAYQNGFYLWKRGQQLKTQRFSRPQRDKFLSFAIIADTLAWSPVDPHLLLVSDADQANIWDVRRSQPLLTLAASADSSTPVISKMSWSPNGRYVAASYDPVGDNTKIIVKPQIYVWDVRALLKQPTTGVKPPTLSFSAPLGSPAHTRAILDFNWSPDGRYLATSSLDHTVIIWKVDR